MLDKAKSVPASRVTEIQDGFSGKCKAHEAIAVISEDKPFDDAEGNKVHFSNDIIEQKACRGISTRDVANALGVSQNLLSLRFHEFSHETVLNAINRVRLEKVKTLLATTQRKFAEIAKSAGFRNANYLKNLFKKRFGMSMREYRAANRP